MIAFVFQVDGAGGQLLPEGFQVAVGADDLDAVLREDAVGRLGNVDPQAAAEDGHYLDAETLAEVQLSQGFSAPVNLGRHVEIGQMEILGKQAGSVFRLLFAHVFGPQFPGPEIVHKVPFQALCIPLDETAGHDGKHRDQGDQEDQHDRNVEEPRQHVEDESQGQDIP